MKLLVDTSVWADFFNGYPSAGAESLAAYIAAEAELATCGVVIAELFRGFREARSIRELEPYFRELVYLAPRDPDDYFAAARLFRELRARGVTVRSTIDCLVAGLAAESDCWLLAKDRDFRHIADSSLIDLTLAPSTPPSGRDAPE